MNYRLPLPVLEFLAEIVHRVLALRLWIGWIRSCRCPRVGRNDMGSRTTATARYRYMPHWM